jgi:hypothetical protein
MKQQQTTLNSEFRGLNIQTDENNNLGCYEDMLEKMHKVFEYYIAKHNKVFFLRFDLNYPQYEDCSTDTDIFKRFTSSYVKHLR